MRILLPVDGSPFARKMLAYLGAHEELFGAAAEFALIHVQSPIPPRARNAVFTFEMQQAEIVRLRPAVHIVQFGIRLLDLFV